MRCGTLYKIAPALDVSLLLSFIFIGLMCWGFWWWWWWFLLVCWWLVVFFLVGKDLILRFLAWLRGRRDLNLPGYSNVSNVLPLGHLHRRANTVVAASFAVFVVWAPERSTWKRRMQICQYMLTVSWTFKGQSCEIPINIILLTDSFLMISYYLRRNGLLHWCIQFDLVELLISDLLLSLSWDQNLALGFVTLIGSLEQ